MAFFPMSDDEMRELGWDACDFIMVTGDAYVDHSSFGMAIIARILEAEGFRVGIIACPNWHSEQDFLALGRPRYGFLVSSGNLDSMLNNYTAAKRKRSEDDYAPGGRGGGRPNRAVIVYCQIIRKLFGNIPIILGGIEASLRRMIHYDYWEDGLRQTILSDAQADLLVYGMGEIAIVAAAQALATGKSLLDVQPLPGTAYISSEEPTEIQAVRLPDMDDMRRDPKQFGTMFRLAQHEENPFLGKALVQKAHRGWLVVQPPARPLSEAELDRIYELPYMRRWHPSYDSLGGVPAFSEVKFSITSHRGCFGGCSFCALSAHQGRIIQRRSAASIIREAKLLTTLPDFKGYIHDLSGPTANFRLTSCAKQTKLGACQQRQCLAPQPCPQLQVDHSDFMNLLRDLRAIPGIKKVFVRSGLRYDYLLLDSNWHDIIEELCLYHISGQLKVAPEHAADKVTAVMGKPPRRVFEEFRDGYREANARLGRDQYLVPYFMSSHPGCGLAEAVQLAEFLRDIRHQPEQVQDFIPTPGSQSTAMYYSGVHPQSGEAVTVIRNADQKKMQRALLQYRRPENQVLVRKALRLAKREDLIGTGAKALVMPERGASSGVSRATGQGSRQKTAASSSGLAARASTGKRTSAVSPSAKVKAESNASRRDRQRKRRPSK